MIKRRVAIFKQSNAYGLEQEINKFLSTPDGRKLVDVRLSYSMVAVSGEADSVIMDDMIVAAIIYDWDDGTH